MAIHCNEKQINTNIIKKYKKETFFSKLFNCGDDGIGVFEKCPKCNSSDLRKLPATFLGHGTYNSHLGYFAQGCADCGYSESWYASQY